MILHLEGDINRYYVQSLCMIFFPGATFGENECARDGVPEVFAKVYKDSDEQDTAEVSIKLNDRICKAKVSVSLSEDIFISTHASVAVGRALFAAGKELLGHIPPWGILTGIRPAKIARDLLYTSGGVIKTKKILRDEYFLNPQKAALAVSVANQENKLLKKLDKNSCSLYISIPFCPSRCSYCSFVSYSTPRLLSLIDEYIDALLFDLKETLEVIRKLNMRIETVYIGGGTPTTLSVAQLKRIFDFLSANIDVSALLEYTLEAGRPDTITKKKLALAKDSGVTRISVNPQTLNDDLLKDIGRRHTVEDFYRAYEIAKESGIPDINVDLIAGLPGDDFKNFSETLDKIIELRPSNITVHTFCVKKASDALRNNSGIYTQTGTDTGKCISYSQLNTKLAGYKPYYMYRQKNSVGNLENVGFSLEGKEGMYNIYMMEEVQTIFAVGAGAVTKLVDYVSPQEKGKTRILRLFREKYPYEYLREYNKRKNNENTEKKSFKEQTFAFFSK